MVHERQLLATLKSIRAALWTIAVCLLASFILGPLLAAAVFAIANPFGAVDTSELQKLQRAAEANATRAIDDLKAASNLPAGRRRPTH